MATQHNVDVCCLDIRAGDVLLSAHTQDFIADDLLGILGQGAVSNIVPEETLAQKLSRIGGIVADNFDLNITRIAVPAGAEAWAINAIHNEYKRLLTTALLRGQIDDAAAFVRDYSRYFAVEPNFYMSLSGFVASPEHASYIKSFNLPNPAATGSGITVRILDSGIEQPPPFTVISGKNYGDPDPTKKADVEDTEGHGTAVASLIHAVAPDADIIVGKVTGGGTVVNEFDCLAGMADHSSASILNLSLELGNFANTTCVCGRRFPATRSAVFKNTIDQLLNAYSELIIVVAAGNKYDPKGPLPPGPSYPARFADVLAVGCVDSGYNILGRYGAFDHNDDVHNNLYFLPGGGTSESVGSAGTPARTRAGTSFSAAYASGLLAVYLSQAGNKARSAVLPALRGLADKSGFGSSFSPSDHGNGALRVY